jgi:hypothetical protein
MPGSSVQRRAWLLLLLALARPEECIGLIVGLSIPYGSFAFERSIMIDG